MGNKKINIFLFIIFFIFPQISKSGLIQPDSSFPLEITPSYDKQPGKGTILTFKFYIPKGSDINYFPTQFGIGATNGQYLGVEFHHPNVIGFDSNPVRHTCKLTRLSDGREIPLEGKVSEMYNTLIAEKNIAYCKVNSLDPSTVIIPGYHYKLVITIVRDITDLDKVTSFTVFTASTNNKMKQIFDRGTFPSVSVLKKADLVNQQPVTMTPTETLLSRGINLSFTFKIELLFNEWFSWSDYTFCVRFPTKVIETEGSVTATLLSIPGASNTIPLGTFTYLNMEEDASRKTVGFSFNDDNQSFKGDKMYIEFSGFRSLMRSLYATNPESYIEIMIRYKNTYEIYSYLKQNIEITSSNVKFTVFHPETKVDSTTGITTDEYDIFRGGAWPMKFTFKFVSEISNKYFLIKQSNAGTNRHVTFIASTCDFSRFPQDLFQKFGMNTKCFPLSYKNNSPTEESGIFFYYPGTLQADTEYVLIVWVFFDECGPEDSNLLFDDTKYRAEIKFGLSLYDDIDKTKHGKDRINEDYLFVSQIESSIYCYNTYMGEKLYNNYLFTYSDYANSETEISAVTANTKEKLFYREYFDWDIYSFDGNSYLTNKMVIDLSDNSEGEKYIYAKDATHKIKETDNLLFRAKVLLQSGNNEKLGQFFPMGMSLNPSGKLVAIKGRVFGKFSSNFFTTDTDKIDNCFVSWGFGSSSISKKTSLLPNSQIRIPQKYNWITNSNNFLSDPLAVYHPQIYSITPNSFFSSVNPGWEYNSVNGYTAAEWGFGTDELVKEQISDGSPVEVYFGLADSCHKYQKLDQKITSVYTPIEIIIGVKWESLNNSIGPRYARVMRFIKLFPEGGVFHDKNDNSYYSKNVANIVTNHYGYMSEQKDSGVCLLEIKEGTLDSGINKSNAFFLWIFMGSLLETDYEDTSLSYPVGNKKNYVHAYGYSSQHSLNTNNFYASPSKTKLSDITSPIYSITSTMTSIFQHGVSGYLYYLGSMLILNNNQKDDSIYDRPNKPILIPYYCPYYQSSGSAQPYSLGIFPAFVGGFGNFENLSNLGNQGMDSLLAIEMGDNHYNRVILSNPKMVMGNTGNSENNFYSTLRFSEPNSVTKTLNVWNGFKSTPGQNIQDSLDAVVFFLNDKSPFDPINEISRNSGILFNQISSIQSAKFYAFGKLFTKAILGVTTNQEVVPNSAPDSDEPFISLETKFIIDYSNYKCEDDEHKFCPTDLVAYWGLSSGHDMTNYFSNYLKDTNQYIMDYSPIPNFKTPIIVLDEPLSIKGEKALSLSIEFAFPFTDRAPIGAVISFTINSIKNQHCAVQSENTDNLAYQCVTDANTGIVSCELKESREKYKIFCYKLNINEPNNTFYFKYFSVKLPNKDITLDTYVNPIILNVNDCPAQIKINDITYEGEQTMVQPTYSSHLINMNGIGKIAFIIDFNRNAHPGMDVVMKLPLIKMLIDVVDGGTTRRIMPRCLLSFSPLEDYGDTTKTSDEIWTLGNSLIYNCDFQTTSSTDFTVHAWLKDEMYKPQKSLGRKGYIYLWPVFVDDIQGLLQIDLTISVNSNSITKTAGVGALKQVSPTINSNPTSVKVNSIPIASVSQVTSGILGDLSDYYFVFDLHTAIIVAAINSLSINEITLLFPYEYFGSNNENVKCYEDTKLLACAFEDDGILNIRFDTNIPSGTDKVVVITGFSNPITTPTENILFGVTYNQVTSLGVRNAIVSGAGSINKSLFKLSNRGKLRYFHVNYPMSNVTPRESSTYTFRFGFDYANKETLSTASLQMGSIIFVEFPPEYNLFINSIPGVRIDEYSSDELTIPQKVQTLTISKTVIYNNRLIITIGNLTPLTSSGLKFKFWELKIDSIINPASIPSGGYTSYYKITCVSTNFDYYSTTINSNSYTSDKISDQNIFNNEYHWYRGNKISLDGNNKYVIDVTLNGITNKLSLEPGRFVKAYITTSSSLADPYLKPVYTDITFTSDVIITQETKYTIPSLYGEPFAFYIGVSCNAAEGQYVLKPVLSNTIDYLDSPTLYINVKLVKKAVIYFDQPAPVPKQSNFLLHFYLSEINADELSISWKKKPASATNTYVEAIVVPKGSKTDYSRRISKVYSKITMEASTLGTDSQEWEAQTINNCYEIYDTLKFQQNSGLVTNSIPTEVSLSNYVSIETFENDNTLLSNEIKIDFSAPASPSFAYCGLLCENKGYPKLSSIITDTYVIYKDTLTDSYFSRYYPIYFSPTEYSKTIIMQDLIRGYNYKMVCGLKSTDSGQYSSTSALGTMDKDPSTGKAIRTTLPPTTTCVKYHYNIEITDTVKKAYINYCQYLYSQQNGYSSNGCIICSDSSGKFLSPGYSLNSFFGCSKGQCYTTADTTDIITSLYNLDSEENTGEISYTVCATSNKICESTANNLETIFDTFITKTKYSSTANTNLGTTSISYNSLYNEKKYYELEVSSSKIKFNFTSPDNQVTADITWEASYSGQDVNCFWKLLLNTSVVPTTEDLVLCGTGDTLCGVMRLNRETKNYEVPSDKKEELRKNKIYNMYVSCTNVVPAPLYFSPVLEVASINTTKDSSSGFIKLCFSCIFVFLIIL